LAVRPFLVLIEQRNAVAVGQLDQP
jgi:hypothetical protein